MEKWTTPCSPWTHFLFPVRVFEDVCVVSSVRSDVRAKRIYIGSMGISDQRFLSSFEDPKSPEFVNLASLVSQQVSRHTAPLHHGSSDLSTSLGTWAVIVLTTSASRLPLSCSSSIYWCEYLCDLFLFQLKLIYSKNSVLAKSFRGSSVQAFRYRHTWNSVVLVSETALWLLHL